ncbi:lipopolysaccharide kinase InaA family protein [Amycolatopsis sp. NPDC059021]|uniref:protein kinase domain-containing protein n=1 Tax=Amycolatopsis sp. NPDC059021 TaxID=3346704 RepID=UPI00366E9468
MKLGETIRGYRITSKPTNDGGGKCVWAFAEQGGKEYFLKAFLEPKRPRDGGTGSASQRRRMAECQEFEQRHRSIMDRLKPDAVGGGNLVLAVDFFHEGSTYYKVTERISVASLESPQSLDPRKKIVLLRTLALSLRQLHDIGVVHGDLKPANVLIQKKPGKTFHTAKLIDFDDSYLTTKPPDRGAIAGDSAYGAPEWLRYLQGDADVRPEYLTTKVDLFALGLMTHLYVTGTLPGFPDRFASAAHAVISDVPLRIDDRLTPGMRMLIQHLTAQSPGKRPNVNSFMATLRDPDICVLTQRTKARAVTDPPAAPTKRSGVRINIDGGRAATPTPVSAPAVPPGAGAESPKTSRVRINIRDDG